jgi:flagellar P-ring protein precursor FlgI
VVLLIALVAASGARAAQVQNLVRLKGSEKSTIVAVGLVVGLNGTGDGGKFAPAMRPLAAVIEHFVDPLVVAAELKDSKNVALVALEASLGESGVREGDRIDVHVSAIGPARSLRGGRLFVTPMKGPLPNSGAYAFASGGVVIEDEESPTVGVIPKGAQLTRNVLVDNIDRHGRLQLVINDEIATWPMAHNLSSLINGLMAPDGPNIAQAIDPKNILVQVPEADRAAPAAFITQILQAYVHPSQIGTGARVLINERSGTIVMSGDVQISPVIISHKGMTITTITPPPQVTPAAPRIDVNGFVPIDPQDLGGAKLNDLLAAFNQLKVGAEDRIAIIKRLHTIGKLHAQLIIE